MSDDVDDNTKGESESESEGDGEGCLREGEGAMIWMMTPRVSVG